MTAAREAVLGNVRAALGPSPEVPEIPREYVAAGGRDAAGSDAVVALFAERVADYEATVHHTDAEGLAPLVLELTGLTHVLVAPGIADRFARKHPADRDLVPTTDEPGVDAAALDGFDAVVTGCAVAIAETGTIVLDGGPDSGRRAISLIPDHHVCAVRTDQIVAAVPDAIAVVKPAAQAGRPLTLVSGPSATSDIELERVEGVHGPRRLDVVIVHPTV